MVGRELGHYRVLEKLGAGGMGEVYRAQDTRLGRDVAIKVLPPEFSRDPERLARFEREARVLASLNHPNIAAIYGFEQHDGVPFLVLELVPGETLKGPLPVEEALALARQMAVALDAAHEKGVVHRDLKPANIKITPERQVKVLDFGLAKALSDEPPAPDSSRSPTMSLAATRAGVILGTAAYMSPEQARAQPVDRRTDIWAFGCVLYEMLAGKQAFPAETISDAIAGVLAREPDWKALPAMTPERLRELLRWCLEKDPRQRLRDIGDARLDLHAPLPASPPRTPSSGRLAWSLLAAATALVAGLVAGVTIWALVRGKVPRPVVRTAVTLPPGDRLTVSRLQPSLALSPDGSRLVYVAVRGGTSQLFLRRLDQLEAVPIPGTEHAALPFFSPDGSGIGFFAGGKLRKVSLSGGAPLTLCEAQSGRGASWGPDDSIIFTPMNAPGTGLSRAPASGGTPQVLTTPDPKAREHSHRWPQVLPGGQAVLFTTYTGENPDENRVSVLRLDTGERRTLVEGATYGQYASTGHLVYARSGGLQAVPFDLSRLRVSGKPFPVLEGVHTQEAAGFAHFSFSGSGSLLYAAVGLTPGGHSLVWVDRQGNAAPVTQLRRMFYAPRLSPDGRRITLGVMEAGNHEVYLYEPGRDTLTRLTFDPAADITPVWTPDGKRVAFGSNRIEAPGLYWKAADGSGADQRLIGVGSLPRPTSFSPDGKWLAFQQHTPATGGDIWLLHLEGERKAKPFLQNPTWEGEAVFAPNGRWLAYTSHFDVYVEPFPGPGGKWQISTGGGQEPVWARNGRELFYRNGDRMMAVEVSTGSSFTAGKPRLLFEGQYVSVSSYVSYDVTPDGRRFLMLKDMVADKAPGHLNLVENWFEELKRR